MCSAGYLLKPVSIISLDLMWWVFVSLQLNTISLAWVQKVRDTLIFVMQLFITILMFILKLPLVEGCQQLLGQCGNGRLKTCLSNGDGMRRWQNPRSWVLWGYKPLSIDHLAQTKSQPKYRFKDKLLGQSDRINLLMKLACEQGSAAAMDVSSFTQAAILNEQVRSTQHWPF